IAGGSASIITNVLPAGTRYITATFSGDANYPPAVTSTLQTVQKATPVVTLAGAPNPSVVSQTVTLAATLSGPFGLPTGTVTFTATVTGAAGVPSGVVTFTSDSGFQQTGVVAGGIASVSSNGLPVGSRAITATYGGDFNHTGSVTTTGQTVIRAASAVALQ